MNRIDGKYLKDLRDERGLSIRELAEKIYVSKSSVQRWEQSSVPENKDILNKLSEVFGISVEDMREQSLKRYGAEHLKDVSSPEDDGLTPDERAEAKFGVKGIGIALCAVCAVLALAVILPIVL